MQFPPILYYLILPNFTTNHGNFFKNTKSKGAIKALNQSQEIKLWVAPTLPRFFVKSATKNFYFEIAENAVFLFH